MCTHGAPCLSALVCLGLSLCMRACTRQVPAADPLLHEAKVQLLYACMALLVQVQPQQVHVERMSGAMTNMVFKCTQLLPHAHATATAGGDALLKYTPGSAVAVVGTQGHALRQVIVRVGGSSNSSSTTTTNHSINNSTSQAGANEAAQSQKPIVTDIVDRQAEAVASLAAAKAGIGAQLLASFGNGRVEECLVGYR